MRITSKESIYQKNLNAHNRCNKIFDLCFDLKCACVVLHSLPSYLVTNSFVSIIYCNRNVYKLMQNVTNKSNVIVD